MRYAALATDYDGTIATRGTVDAPTLAALRRGRAAGLRTLLVTGRESGNEPQMHTDKKAMRMDGIRLHPCASAFICG